MSDQIKKEELDELKKQLWDKINYLEVRIQGIDQESENYRKALDIYHKLVKSYLDIIKVQRYAPGSELDERDLSALFEKVKQKVILDPNDKKAMQQFKELLDVAEKRSLMVNKG